MKLFYLLIAGAIVSLSSCNSGPADTCYWCGKTYYGDGYAPKPFENDCFKTPISTRCSKKCCMGQ
ncbi:hypothetical protein OAK24_00740 [Flavobacteriales bacterium]|nr:hypothetical protein [Flavobacteriales bacterium]